MSRTTTPRTGDQVVQNVHDDMDSAFVLSTSRNEDDKEVVLAFSREGLPMTEYKDIVESNGVNDDPQ